VVARLNGELGRIMHSSEMKERLDALATDPVTGTPEEFAELIRREIAKWGEVVREAGLKAD
jgi:tripartite-type tricarboxylate transporter receptor subunit TctC